MNNQTKVVLPAWIFEQAQDKEHLKQLVLIYMRKGYPTYQVKRIKNGLAVCEFSR
ncbi:hypothetical protein ACUXCC_003440 [Cytobacillus horneckiae]|uniref:hypothetical protein n=1 Tax=Cytobacillus horneckiae TaxID=549687 RepID=UPI0019D21969|nr:hypothetical protein [Cytobacillus horneckiae]MBN6889933.1 hypothetical protein [Cytobacillus horneckiae]